MRTTAESSFRCRAMTEASRCCPGGMEQGFVQAGSGRLVAHAVPENTSVTLSLASSACRGRRTSFRLTFPKPVTCLHVELRRMPPKFRMAKDSCEMKAEIPSFYLLLVIRGTSISPRGVSGATGMATSSSSSQGNLWAEDFNP